MKIFSVIDDLHAFPDIIRHGSRDAYAEETRNEVIVYLQS